MTTATTSTTFRRNSGGSIQATPILASTTTILRLEAAAVLAGAAGAFAHVGGSWGLFALLFLTPDLAMLGYLANPRLGAFLYNLAHTYLGPALLLVVAHLAAETQVVAIALIWIAHIAFDRMVGYGLKNPDAFGSTHLVSKTTPAAGSVDP